jgi:hypothetical protein
MIRIKSMEQNDSLVAALEDARASAEIHVSQTADMAIRITEIDREGDHTGHMTIYVDGEVKDG